MLPGQQPSRQRRSRRTPQFKSLLNEIVPSTPAQPTTAPLQTPAAVQAPGKEAQTGGSMQQQDDAPPQEQSDSTGTQARVNALTDVKAKPAELNREDSGTATPAHDRAADTIAEPAATSFPDQTTFIESAPATTTPASAAPFQGTAEAIRTSEPSLPADPPQRAGAAQEISIRIAQPDASTIDLRVVERSGQVARRCSHFRYRDADVAAPGFGNAHQFAGAGGLSQRDIHAVLNSGRTVPSAPDQQSGRPSGSISEPRRLRRFFRRPAPTATTKTPEHLARRIGRSTMSTSTLPISSIAALSAPTPSSSSVTAARQSCQPEHLPATAGRAVKESGSRTADRRNGVRHRTGAVHDALGRHHSATDLNTIVAALPSLTAPTTPTTPANRHTGNTTQASNQ